MSAPDLRRLHAVGLTRLAATLAALVLASSACKGGGGSPDPSAPRCPPGPVAKCPLT